ncbi:MAG: 1-acyl-sn-glycerol-3-phosphate acyltransferase [Deltaproteobacteria bacterium]|nr:1-acyl-sn-glycerol-3-phosphate acyltransferase [Deltaproteobacteria bacterium]
MRTLLSWVGTALFATAFGLTLLIFDVIMRIAFLAGRVPSAYVMGALQTVLIADMRLAGIRVDVERSRRIRPRTPYIIVSNHQSMFDIPVFGWQFFTNFPKYISKLELAKWIPAISVQLRRGGHALIDRKDRTSAVQAIRKLGHEITAHGVSAVIYPEGTRARNGELAPFKPIGTLALLKEAPDTPVVPVCIDNSWRIMQHGMKPIPWGIRLRFWAGDPIERKAGEDPSAVIAECERQIHAAMARFRAEAAAA